jgi:hypothetical protein
MTMKNSFRAISLSVMVLQAGCADFSLDRMAYGAVQGVRRQQCEETTTSKHFNECYQAESYDEYKRKLKDLNTSK